jgi:hypothetical protein
MVYTAGCPACEHVQTYMRSMAERNNTPDCDECGTKTEKRPDHVMVGAIGIADHASFVSPIDGRRYYGKTQMNEHNKKHGVLPQSELKGEASYQKAEQTKKDRAARKKQIGEVVRDMT